MKKLLIGTVVTALVLTVGATTAFAAGGRHFSSSNGYGVCNNQGSYCRYVDANGDGVCDYHGTYCRHTDANGDGVCDYHGSSCWYTDTNGDGVCDNYGTGCHGQGRGHHGW